VEGESQGHRPLSINPQEPEQVAKAAAKLNLAHVVVTSVTRDDLPDQGAGQFKATINAIKQHLPHVTVEVLTSDFQGNTDCLDQVLCAQPTVFNHNVETAPRLYPTVRPQANYRRSLDVLRYSAKYTHHSSPITHHPLLIKSGLMLGLGETQQEVLAVLEDLHQTGVDIITIGQYLPPSRKHIPVREYIHPDQFEMYQRLGEEIGIPQVFSGPLVRSSYQAKTILSAKTTIP